MIRPANQQEEQNWDNLVQANPDGGHIYQSWEWTQFKKINGWQPEYYVFEEPGVIVYFALISKPISFLGTIYYCSKGPGEFAGFHKTADSAKQFSEFCTQLQRYISQHDRRAILVKLEPELLDGELDMHKFGLHKAKADLQFKATIFVDLKPSEEEIIGGFKQKTRYNIRLAERKDVKVERREMTKVNVDLMYNLMAATQSRAKFFLRKKDYFAGYWQGLDKAGLGQFLVASHEGDVLAGIFATRFGSKGYYKDGGSFSIKRNLMAPYLLQWEAMRWAKEQGAKTYDMVAVPPKAHLEDPNHHQAGLYQFKRGFNEEITEFVGCWDLPVAANKYRIWQRQEAQFLRLYAKMKKNLFW